MAWAEFVRMGQKGDAHKIMIVINNLCVRRIAGQLIIQVKVRKSKNVRVKKSKVKK